MYTMYTSYTMYTTYTIIWELVLYLVTWMESSRRLWLSHTGGTFL